MDQLKENRLKAANEMIQIISDHGRRFFYKKDTDTVAYLKIKNKKRLPQRYSPSQNANT